MQSFSTYKLYPYGMLMPNRHAQQASGDYRYGYQGSEKDDEIKGSGNSYTTYYRQLDTRVGRWFSIDPKATAWESPYVSMGNSPIMNNDPLGDTLGGVNENSANTMMTTIRDGFAGNKPLQNLFKLKTDGKTFEKISPKAFAAAIASESKEVKQLAYAYFLMINDDKKHLVNMISKTGEVDPSIQAYFVGKTGETINRDDGGGVNGVAGNTSISIIIIDCDRPLEDNFDGSTNPSSPGELLAHEAFGHGYQALIQSPTSRFIDAVQMTNLFRRANIGGNSVYRTGRSHEHSNGRDLDYRVATDVPSSLKKVDEFINKNVSPAVKKYAPYCDPPIPNRTYVGD